MEEKSIESLATKTKLLDFKLVPDPLFKLYLALALENKVIIREITQKGAEYNILMVYDECHGDTFSPVSMEVSVDNDKRQASLFILNQNEDKESLIQIKLKENYQTVQEYFLSDGSEMDNRTDGFCIFDHEIIRWNFALKRVWSSSRNKFTNSFQFLEERVIPLEDVLQMDQRSIMELVKVSCLPKLNVFVIFVRTEVFSINYIVVRANANDNAKRRIYKNWAIQNYKDYIFDGYQLDDIVVVNHYPSAGKFFWRAQKISVNGAKFVIETNMDNSAVDPNTRYPISISMLTGTDSKANPSKSIYSTINVVNPSVKFIPKFMGKLNFFYHKLLK